MTQAYLKRRLTRARGILFDLDNTLYPKETGVFDMIRDRIGRYVGDLTGLGPSETLKLRREYIGRYGTTLAGLIRNYRVDPEQFLSYVHDVPVEEMLVPDPDLASFLESIKLPKLVFTNASLHHARKTLRILGVDGFFQGICDLASTGYTGKPHRAAFNTAARMLERPLSDTIFVDDVTEYLEAGKRLGVLAVHLGTGDDGSGHLQAEKVTDLEKWFERMPWYEKNSSEF